MRVTILDVTLYDTEKFQYDCPVIIPNVQPTYIRHDGNTFQFEPKLSQSPSTFIKVGVSRRTECSNHVWGGLCWVLIVVLDETSWSKSVAELGVLIDHVGEFRKISVFWSHNHPKY